MKRPIQTVNARARLPLDDYEWVVARAQENFRSFNAELLACIAIAKKEVQAMESMKAKRKRT